jgi:hypothetical protein
VHGDRIAVEVGVEPAADEGIDADDVVRAHRRAKGSRAVAVEAGGTIQHHNGLVLGEDILAKERHELVHTGSWRHFDLQGLEEALGIHLRAREPSVEA